VRLEFWLLAALACGGTLAACRDLAQPRFPHAVHLVELECGGPGQPSCLSCNSCHTPSRPEREQKLPAQALCESCHQQDLRQVLPALHAAPERPYGKIAFDHDRHLKMDGIGGQCVPCHQGVVKPGSASMPPMSQCFSCHEHDAQWQSGECAPCHERGDLRRSLPQTFLKHDLAFARHHGERALDQAELCQSCHTQSDCQACHDVTQGSSIEQRRPERLDASFVHRADFVTRHAGEARAQPARCLSCHSTETCDSCHVERGVSGNRLDARNPHPPGWVGTAAMGQSFHGSEARRDIVLCASCHEQGPATNCIRCHQVGGYGGNPHPRGWRSARGTDSEMCRYCHG
jgi:hypothetical protein